MKTLTRLLLGIVILASLNACGGGGGSETHPGTLQFSASSYSGNEDNGAITVSVTRSGGSDGAVSVDVSDTGSGTATSGNDYAAITPTTLSWANGDTSTKSFVVSVNADGLVEPDETVILALNNVTGGATLGTSSTTVTILNDDVANVPGTLQFDPTSYTVAENGSGTATITVTRIGGNQGAVTVDYATNDGTATAGSDYTATTGTLSWASGVSGPQTFTVSITNDTLVEPNETVNLSLSNPTGGATLGTSTAILTITSDDAYGVLEFNATSYTVNETDGTVNNVIGVQRVNGSSGTVSVDVSDLGTGSATGSGTDYIFTSPTTLTWGDGDTSVKYVTITLVNDTAVEGTETVNLSLGNVSGGASIGSPSTSTVEIADDDAPAAAGELQFDSTSYSVTESGVAATITVNRINGSSGAVGVSYASSDGSAIAGSDYTAVSGTLTWADGDTAAKTFTVPIINDANVESTEALNLALSNPTGGAVLASPSSATLTIFDDDSNLTMNIGNGNYWVAFQDGPTGTWTKWSPTIGNTYNFPVTDTFGRYGVAFHRQESDGVNTVNKTYVILATLNEISNMDAFASTLYSVSGTMSNYTGSNDSATVGMYVTGDGGDSLALPYLYTIPVVPEGLRDLVAAEYVASSGTTGKFVIRRNVDIAGDLTGQDIDFTNDADMETFSLTPHNFFGSTAGQELEVYYSTSNGTAFNLESGIYDGTNALIYNFMANSSLRQTGDSYSFQISNSTGSKHRIRNFSAVTDPGDQSMGLGSVASLTGVSVNTTQATGLSYIPDPTSFSGSPVFRLFQIDLDQTVAGIDGGAHWQFKISAGWLGGALTAYAFPSFASVSGFNTAWDMSSGTLTHATVSAGTSNGGTGLRLIVRKTMGRSSINLNPDTWVVAKKLAQSDSLKLDIASKNFDFTW